MNLSHINLNKINLYNNLKLYRYFVFGPCPNLNTKKQKNDLLQVYNTTALNNNSHSFLVLANNIVILYKYL